MTSINNLLLSPFYILRIVVNLLIIELMKMYASSLACSGMVSSIVHEIVRFLMWTIKCITLLRTFYYPLLKSKKLPGIKTEVLKMSATEIAHNIRTRKIKCEEVVAAFIQRINDVNPILNAVVEERFQDALKEARIVDELLTARPGVKYWKKSKPLLGVPISVKESIAVKGMSNHAARVHTDNNRATEDAEVIALLRKAGAIPLVVSNTPEMCMNYDTYNIYRGYTRNPYDTRRTAGGSSGGEGALVGSAASVVGIGSDLGGSVRCPGYFCCHFAHKCTAGFIPVHGHIPSARDPNWDSYFTIGPMTRYAEDLLLTLTCMIPDRNGPELLKLDEPVDIRKIKFFYIDSFGSGRGMSSIIDPDVKSCLMKSVNHFKKAYGINVQKVELKEVDDLVALGVVLLLRMKGIENIYMKSETQPEEWNNMISTLFKLIMSRKYPSLLAVLYGPLSHFINSIPEKEMKKLYDKKLRIQKQIEDLLGDDGVLISPTFSCAAPYLNRVFYKLLDVSFMLLYNIIGLPATECPIELNNKGIPLGVQVIASRYQDRLCLATAKALQDGFGGWKPPPS